MKKITSLIMFLSSLWGYSQCTDVTAFTENFDSYTAGQITSPVMPPCWGWYGTGNPTGAATVYTGSKSPMSASNYLYLLANSSLSPAKTAYAILPPVSNLNAETHRLKFKAYSTSSAKKLDVGYFTDVVAHTGFTVIQTIDLPSAAITTAIEFDIRPLKKDVPDGIKNIVLRNACAGSTAIYVDDVIWQPIPPCTDLKNVLAKLPTSSSVVLSWDVTGPETAWQYAVTPSTVTDPSTISDTSIISVAAPAVTGDPISKNVTVGDLSASTSYKIWIRSTCGSGQYGLWFPTPAFTTPCDTRTTILEDFDLNTSLPSCWRTMSNSGNAGSASVVAGKGKGGSNGLVLENKQGNGQIFAFIPPLSTAMTGGSRLRFTYKASGTGGTMDIISYKDPINFSGATTDYTVLSSKTISTTNVEYEFNEALPITNSPYLAIRFTTANPNYSLYVDNFVWEPLPACTSDVSAISINKVADTSVKIDWTTDDFIGEWQYALGSPTTVNPNSLEASQFSEITGTSTSKSAKFSGLTPSTTYKFWIRSKCIDGKLGSWIGPSYFTTNCPAVQGFTEKFDSSTSLPSCWSQLNLTGVTNPIPTASILTQGTNNVLKIQGKISANGQLVVAIQPVSNYSADTHLLRFKLSGDKVGTEVELGYLKNPLDVSTFVPLNKKYTVGSTTVYSDETADLGMNPDSQVLAFKCNGHFQFSTLQSVYIDDVVWEPKPTCPDIKDRVVTGATSTTVSVSWTKGTSEDEWQYALTDTAETDPKKLNAVTFDNPTVDGEKVSATITGLTPSTNYKIWIRPKCTTTLFGGYASALPFTTSCAPTQNGFTEKFDASTTLPTCWTEMGTQGKVTVVDGIGGASTPNVLKLVSEGTAKAMVALPPSTHTTDGTYRLRFKFRSDNIVNPLSIQVGYVTSISDPSSFTAVQSFDPSSQEAFFSKTVLLNNIPKAEILAIRNQGSNVLYIDDVIWEPIPSCSDISGLTVKKTASNAIDLGWKAGGNETAWQYFLGDNEPTETIAGVDFIDPTINGKDITGHIPNLSPATSYKIWIRSKCSDTSFGVWTESITVKTNCLPKDTFKQNFDSGTTMPGCWSKVGAQGTANIQAITGAPSGANTLYLYTSSATNLPVVAMDPVSNASNGTHRLKFKFAGNIAGGILEVGYLKVASDPDSFTSFNPAQKFAVATANVYQNAIANFGTQSGLEILAFRNGGPVGQTGLSLNIDDVIWAPIPSCLEISGLAPNKIASNQVELGWRAGGSETAWQYAMIPSTEPDPAVLTGIDFENPTVNSLVVAGKINNLTPSTTYKVWVRAKCSETSFGEWSAPIYFKTNCVSTEGFIQEFDSSLNIPSCWNKVGNQGTVEVQAVSGTPSGANALFMNCAAVAAKPVVALPPVSNGANATHRLRFKFKGNAVGATIEVGYLTLSSDPASFVSLKSFTSTTNAAYEFASADLGTQPLSEVLAFRTAGVSSFHIDNVVWEPLPTCPDVKNLDLKSITPTTAIFKWDIGGSESKWQYAKGISTDEEPSSVTAVDVTQTPTEITLTDLTPSTTYKIWVRSMCDEKQGTWQGPLYVNTPCLPVSDFTENFDTTDANSLPACWRKIGSQGTGAVIIKTSGPASPSGTKCLAINSPTQQTLAVVAMPALNNIADGSHMLKFKVAGAMNGAVDVGYVIDISNPASFVFIKRFTLTAPNVYQQQTLIIDAAPESPVLAFRNVYNDVGVWIDDVNWQHLPNPPACADATATPNASCGNFATTISWPAVSSANGYKITVGSTPGASDLAENIDLGNKLTYSVTGESNKTYYYKVTPYNLGGGAIGCEEKSFITVENACYCASQPTSKNENGISNVMVGASNFAVPISSNTYFDFTSKQVNLAVGANANLKISFYAAFFSETVKVWIDFNDNKTFEPNELVLAKVAEHGTALVFDASFVMPPHSPLGMHRMRIGMSVDAFKFNSDPCFNGAKGMTLDFNVNLVSSPENDYVEKAQTLTVGKDFAEHAISGTNMDATGSIQETTPECGNYSGSDVWYSAVVPSSGSITFEVNSVDGGITNTAAAVYAMSMELVACDDSSSTTGKSEGSDQPKISLIGRTPGETLYLRVWENGGDAYGSYEVSAYDFSLSNDQFQTGSFNYYPNPVNDALNISLDQQISDVVVMNMLGQQVITKSVNANQAKIDMSDLTPGTYLVKITAGIQSKTIKAIKK